MIKWNVVTWYSKLLAILFFLLALPILTFYIGTQYEKTIEIMDGNYVVTPKAEREVLSEAAKDTSNSIVIGDPLKYYFHPMLLHEGDDIYRIDIDLNGDGYKETLLTDNTPNSNNGQAGNIWQVFVNDKHGSYYLPKSLDSQLSLGSTLIDANLGALGYALMPGDSIKSLITYAPDSATTGSLVWYKIINDKIVEKYQRIEPEGKDKDLYDKYIQNPLSNPSAQVKIQDIHVSNTTLGSPTIEKASGEIKSVYSKSGKNYIDIDYIELNPNWIPGGSGGPAYTNTNPKIRTFEIASNAKFFLMAGPANVPITFRDFSNLFISTGIVNGVSTYNYQKGNPWDIVVTDGVVTQITEHYFP